MVPVLGPPCIAALLRAARAASARSSAATWWSVSTAARGRRSPGCAPAEGADRASQKVWRVLGWRWGTVRCCAAPPGPVPGLLELRPSRGAS